MARELVVDYYALTTRKGRQTGLFRRVRSTDPLRDYYEYVNGEGDWVSDGDLARYLFRGEEGARKVDEAAGAAWYKNFIGREMPPAAIS